MKDTWWFKCPERIEIMSNKGKMRNFISWAKGEKLTDVGPTKDSSVDDLRLAVLAIQNSKKDELNKLFPDPTNSDTWKDIYNQTNLQ